jgi:hypothetical protein
MPARITVFAICAAALQVAACDQTSGYRGDGTLTDFGATAAHERYLVDLGVVDLSHPNEQAFRLLGLPATELTMGLRPVNISAGCDAAAVRAVRVRLVVSSHDGAVVIFEEGPLSAWTTSSSLIYRRGAEREEPLSGGGFRLIPTGTREFGGWGTYFTPKSSEAYVAKLAVVDTSNAVGCQSRLVLLGGGWK